MPSEVLSLSGGVEYLAQFRGKLVFIALPSHGDGVAPALVRNVPLLWRLSPFPTKAVTSVFSLRAASSNAL